MKTVNLTPHTINIFSEDGTPVLSIEPSGQVARVSATRQLVAVGQNGIPFYQTTYGAVSGLPDPEADTIYIVSGLVRAAMPERIDLWQPGELLRNEAGQPVGCIGLQQ